MTLSLASDRLAGGLAVLADSESGPEWRATLAGFLLFDPLPILFAALLTALVVALPAAILLALAAAILPALLLELFPFLLAGGVLSALAGDMGGMTLLAIWIAGIALLGSLTWDRLPLGLGFADRARRHLAVPPDLARRRLVPDGSPWHRPLDLAWSFPVMSGHDVPAQIAPVTVTEDGTGTIRFREANDGRRRFSPVRDMTYQITAAKDGGTDLLIDIQLSGLAPLAWWDLWSRPYAEDYADHVAARAAGAKDRSIYGRLVRKTHEKIRKRSARPMRRSPA